MIDVALVDLGMGNLRSVERALDRAATDAGLASRVTRTSDPDAIARADKVVVPGQGAFRDCAAKLATGMGDALRDAIARGAPYLGICLGLQALFEGSDEAVGAAGLGVFRGRVVKLPSRDGAKVPYMGWNPVTVREPRGLLASFAGHSPYFYFVHSFHALAEDRSIVVGVTHHGDTEVAAMVARDNVLATQFHPEKSQVDGLALLAAFLEA